MKKVQKDKQNKEYEKKLKKAGITVLSVSVLTAGTVGVVSAYQNGKDYKPSKKERKLQDNQVVFSDNEDTVGHKKDKKKENSELLKKDQKVKDSAQNEENPGYLFENSNMLLPENNAASIIAEGNGLTASKGNNNGNIYNLTGDSSHADMLINGGPGGKGNSLSPGASTTGNTEKKGNDSNTKKENPASEVKKPGSGEDSKPSGPKDDPTPVRPRPSMSAKDPDTVKNTPISGIISYKPFTEGIVPRKDTDENGENNSVIILPASEYDSNMLYKGQSVNESTIYNALDTFVTGKDGSAYVWGTEAYGKYIRVSGISFDSGTTWNNEFPVTIPDNLEDGQMKIRIEYRLSTSQQKWGIRDVDYDPKNTRLFVLSREIQEGEEKIDPATIVNNSEQYPDLNSRVNLLRLQEKLLGSERLTQLFPGWMEDGKLVDGFYTVTSGRHILEPADMVPLDSSFVVKVKYVWMSDDYKVDGDKYNNLCYLQALTDMDTLWRAGRNSEKWQAYSSYETLSVPKYIQAVMIDENAGLSVNYIKIPSTVLYIDIQKSGMRVNQGYIIDKNNPNYASTEEGLLMNKEATEILSIPYNKTAITIPDTVEKIQVEKKNQLKKITVKRSGKEALPEINYANLKNCKVIVDDDQVEELLKDNQEYFSKKTGNTVVSSENQKVNYYVEDGMIIDNSGNLRKILESGNKRIKLPNDIKNVEDTAFAENKNINSIIMPKNGKEVPFEKGSLENSSVNTILCYGEKQYQSVVRQLEQYGIQNITAEMLKKSKEGYGYTVEYTDGTERSTLIDAPDEVEMFDGTVTATDGSQVQITEIGENAFNGCENLKWAFLPESVDTIGGQAFMGCSSLQGIMIRNTEKISIGYGALDGCDSLRFVGSNAMDGEFLDGYDPMVTDSRKKMKYFYVPTGSTGYSGNCIHFVETSGVASYDVVSDGGNGWILYGLDEYGDPWLALRSGDTVADKLDLPETTIEIYSYAFADTKSENGEGYTVDFESTMAWALDEGAFYNSDIEGNVVLNADSYVFDFAFQGCEKMKLLDLPGTGELNIGENIANDCTNLKTVRIGKMNGRIYTGTFTGCSQLTDLYFEDETPPDIGGVMNFGHRFNLDWSLEEENQNLHIHVPAGTEKDYVKAWRYYYAGYSDMPDKPAYQAMWNDVQWENINWDTWEMPEDSVVDEKLKEKLLTYENCIWTMLGKDTVTEPVDFYPYHVDANGYVRLAGVPSDVTKVDLYDTAFMGLPDGWYYDGIEPYAFAGAKNLKKVILPYNLSELSNNAFAGIETDSLTVTFDEYWAIDLVLEDDQPFSFGVDDSVLHLEVPEEMQDEYIKTWSYKLAGYNDLDSMRESVKAELEADGKESTDTEVDKEIAARLLPQVNRLRKMMGLEEIEKLDTEAFGLNVQDETEETKDAGEPEKEQEEAQKNKELQENEQTDMNQDNVSESEQKTENDPGKQKDNMTEEKGTKDSDVQQPQEGESTDQSKITKEEGSVAGQTISGSGKEINE